MKKAIPLVKKTAENTPNNTQPVGIRELTELADAAQKGDATALGALTERMKGAGAVGAYGDLARAAQMVLLKTLGQDEKFVEGTVAVRMELMRAELAGPSATPLERALAERIVACWLHVNHLELMYGAHYLAGKMNPTVAAYYQKALTAANKRYLASIKALAQVRKMGLPSIQVNIAKKQVNVSGG